MQTKNKNKIEEQMPQSINFELDDAEIIIFEEEDEQDYEEVEQPLEEDDQEDADNTEEKSSTSKGIVKLLHQRNQARRELAQTQEKLTAIEKEQELIKKFADAENYIQEIRSMVKSLPGITHEGAYKLIKFDELNDEADVNKTKSNKKDITGHTQAALRQKKSFDNMSSNQQLEELKKDFKKGKLKI